MLQRSAEHALGERPSRGACDDRAPSTTEGSSPSPTPTAESASAADAAPPPCLRAKSPPEVPGGTAERCGPCKSGGRTPCRSRWPRCRSRRRSARPRTPPARRSRSGVVAAIIAATVATPVFAMALPAPRRPPRSSAIPSSVLRAQAEPRGQRRGEERRHQQRPSLPSGRHEDRRCRSPRRRSRRTVDTVRARCPAHATAH